MLCFLCIFVRVFIQLLWPRPDTIRLNSARVLVNGKAICCHYGRSASFEYFDTMPNGGPAAWDAQLHQVTQRSWFSLSYCSASSQGPMKPQCRMWAQHPCSHGFSSWFQCTSKMRRAEHWFCIICMVEVVLLVKIPFISQPSGDGRWETEWGAQGPSKDVT